MRECSRREALAALGGLGASSVAGCLSGGGECSEEGLEKDLNLGIGVREFEENEFVQNMDGGENVDRFEMSYNGSGFNYIYGSESGFLSEGYVAGDGTVHVGNTDGQKVVRYFKVEKLGRDYAAVETGLDTESPLDQDFRCEGVRPLD